MEKAAEHLKRVRQRYEALVHERAALVSTGKAAPLIEEQLSNMESEYPALLPSNPASRKSTGSGQPSPPLNASADSSETDVKINDAARRSCSSRSSPSPQSSAHARLRKSAPPSLIMQAPPSARQVRSLSADTPSRHASKTRTRPGDTSNHFTMMFALQLFNERHQKTIVSPVHVVLIALLSISTALAHCTVVDPSSMAGSLLGPSLLTLLVHGNILCELYIRRKRRFTAPMLIVYCICDIIPSLGLGIVSYNLALIALEIYGLRRASYAC